MWPSPCTCSRTHPRTNPPTKDHSATPAARAHTHPHTMLACWCMVVCVLLIPRQRTASRRAPAPQQRRPQHDTPRAPARLRPPAPQQRRAPAPRRPHHDVRTTTPAPRRPRHDAPATTTRATTPRHDRAKRPPNLFARIGDLACWPAVQYTCTFTMAKYIQDRPWYKFVTKYGFTITGSNELKLQHFTSYNFT